MQATNRVDLVDALRGFALLGLFLVHCVERYELHWLDPHPGPWFNGVFAVFSGKSFAIFALLFGFSFATIMANERARGGDLTLRFAWRLILLFAIGTVHGNDITTEQQAAKIRLCVEVAEEVWGRVAVEQVA